MKKLKLLARKYKLYLLEDCALALGASVEKKHVGLIGDVGFSFYPVKHITTGEGGMIILNSKKILKIIKKKKSIWL